MKRINVARKFYPRLRYLRINISKLLAALLQLGVLQHPCLADCSVRLCIHAWLVFLTHPVLFHIPS